MENFFASPIFVFCCFLVSLLASANIVLSEHNNMLYQNGLKHYHQLELPGVIGPESIAFDCQGKGPYVSVNDGRILRWRGAEHGWTEFAISSPLRDRKLCDGSLDSKLEPRCGRPLGLKFNPATCDLYIADAYYGLLVVGRSGGVAKQLVNSAGGVPFKFTNALDIDNNTGMVYFTDSSIYFQRREYLLAIISSDRTGRLLQYDPRTNEVTVLYKGLALPNGVTLSKDNSFLLIAEVAKMRILKFPLTGDANTKHTPQVFAQLERFPDNIKRNAEGDFWVALNTGRGKIEGLNLDNMGRERVATWWVMNDPVAAKLSEKGEVVQILDGESGQTLESVSEVEEHNGILWIGSSIKPYLGYIKN